jgi:hypothetical protein
MQLLADQLREQTSVFESVLARNVDVTPFVVLPIMAFICLRGDPAGLRIVPDLEPLIDPVLKWAAVASLASFRLFVRNPDGFIRTSEGYDYQSNVQHRVFPSFGLIQTAFGLSPDKSAFLIYVAKVFGLFHREPCDDDAITIRNIEFSCLHFILCLLFDRISLAQDLPTARGMIAATRLTHTPTLSLADLGDIFGSRSLRYQQFMADLATYTTMVHTRNQLLFRIRDGVFWHPILPFVRLPWILDAMNGFASRNANSLVPFPDFSDEPAGLSFRSAFMTPFVFGMIYHFLSNFTHEPDRVSIESLNLICNLTISIAKLFPDLSNPISLAAQNLEELVRAMPAATDAIVQYRDRAPASILDLLGLCGSLGRLALDKLHRAAPAPPGPAPKPGRQRALELRQSVLSSFRAQQNAFMAASEEAEDAADECVVCHLSRPNECFGFPVYYFPTVLPSFVHAQLENAPFVHHDDTFGFHLCEHLVHLSCFRSRSTGRCPIDRGRRNAILPRIDHDIPNPEEIEADTRFMREVFNEDAPTALRSLAGEVNLLEIRSRTRLGSLSKTSTHTKLFYLFMCIRRYARDRLHTLPVDPSEALLRSLLQCESLPRTVGEFIEIMQLCLTSEMSPASCFAFMRRAFIIEHFLLRIGTDRSVNWAESLSSTKLREHFGFPPWEPMVTLPIFTFLKLPEKFLDFTFKVDLSIVSPEREIGVCLLTGKIIETDWRARDELSNHINRALGRTFTPWLVLVGKDASNVSVVTSRFRGSALLERAFPLKNFYVDSLGYEDKGLIRGQILKLSRENLDNVVETVLAGEWVDCETV